MSDTIGIKGTQVEQASSRMAMFEESGFKRSGNGRLNGLTAIDDFWNTNTSPSTRGRLQTLMHHESRRGKERAFLTIRLSQQRFPVSLEVRSRRMIIPELGNSFPVSPASHTSSLTLHSLLQNAEQSLNDVARGDPFIRFGCSTREVKMKKFVCILIFSAVLNESSRRKPGKSPRTRRSPQKRLEKYVPVLPSVKPILED